MARTSQFQQFLRTLQKARRENLEAEGKPLPLSKKEIPWTRRRFVKTALAGSAGFAATALAGRVKAASNPKIAVVGGGIAGLNAAYQLKKLGLNATVYEARGRLGGRILSATDILGQGLVTDLGGSFINTDHADLLALVKDFRLKLFDRVKDAKRSPFPDSGYYFDGRIVPEAEVAEKLRPLARQISKDAKLLDRDFDRFAPEFDRLSVAQYLNRHSDKIPAPFIRELIENTIRTEYGAESNQSSALQLLFLLPVVNGNDVELLSSSDETFVVEGGSGQIIEGLARSLSGRIRTGMVLTKLESRGMGFRLTFNGNNIIEADYAIVAIPFTVLRQVELRVNLPQTLLRFINEVDLGLNEKVFAAFRNKVWRRDDGFVLEAWTDLGFSEVWEDTQRQTNRQDGALTFYLGGNEVIAAQSGSADSQGRKFVNQFDEFIPGLKEAATGRFWRTEWSKSRFTRGGYTNFKPGQYTRFADFLYIESNKPAERQDVRVGNLVFAGEHLSDEFYGFMNGAAQTGRLAAEAVARLV